MITKLSATQRRQLILEIADSQDAPPAAKAVADAAMNLFKRSFNGMAHVLDSEEVDLDEPIDLDNDYIIHAIILPVGERCNLRCKYCFQPSKSVGKMSTDVLEAIISQVLDMCPGTADFIFHGGEPLLAGIEFFETVIALQEKYLKPEQRVINQIQTNATLLNEEWGHFFAEHKFRVGTSIDGPCEVHDSNRIDASGRGTLSRVIEGVKVAQECGINMHVISVVTCPPKISPQELLDFLASLDITRFRVNPCSDPELSQCYGEYIEEIFDIWVNSADGNPISEILDILRGSIGYPRSTCRMTGHCRNFIGFRPDGTIKPCCERSLDAEFDLGNILEDSLVDILEGPSAQSFWDSKREGDSHCHECEWWGTHCGGGCTHSRIVSGGSPVVKDPLCKVYMDTFQRLTARIDQVLLEGVGEK
jgi:uncharacterized protein